MRASTVLWGRYCRLLTEVRGLRRDADALDGVGLGEELRGVADSLLSACEDLNRLRRDAGLREERIES